MYTLDLGSMKWEHAETGCMRRLAGDRKIKVHTSFSSCPYGDSLKEMIQPQTALYFRRAPFLGALGTERQTCSIPDIELLCGRPGLPWTLWNMPGLRSDTMAIPITAHSSCMLHLKPPVWRLCGIPQRDPCREYFSYILYSGGSHLGLNILETNSTQKLSLPVASLSSDPWKIFWLYRLILATGLGTTTFTCTKLSLVSNGTLGEKNKKGYSPVCIEVVWFWPLSSTWTWVCI